MKGLYRILLPGVLTTLLCSTIYLKAQESIGLGTDFPNMSAIMELVADDKGLLIPRMSTGDRNLNLGALVPTDEGMLIYNTTDDEFNYWDGTMWIAFPASTDDDWSGAGTGLMSPTTITDDVSIGSVFNLGTLNVSKTYTVGDNSIYNRMFGSSAGNYTGLFNLVAVTNATMKTGILNGVTGSATSNVYGILNQLQDTGNGLHYGVHNQVFGSGSGAHYAVYNTFSQGTGIQHGVYNNFPSTATLSSILYGNYTLLEAAGNGARFGNFVRTDGAGTGARYGSYINMIGTSNGTHYGNQIDIDNTGTGLKYGVHVDIANAAGGDHYGIYSSVLKAGNTWAGYFLGDVYIGTTNLNGYNFPGTDGTATYIMQTDGAGQASWIDPATLLSADHDWYEVGGTSPPNTITDDMFHTGNVGIGVSAGLVYQLELDGGNTPLRVTGGGLAFPKLTLDVQAPGDAILRLYDFNVVEDFRFATNGDSWLNGSGNVGIGLTNPAQQLDIAQDLRIGGDDVYSGITGSMYFHSDLGYIFDLEEDGGNSQYFRIRNNVNNILFRVDHSGQTTIDGNLKFENDAGSPGREISFEGSDPVDITMNTANTSASFDLESQGTIDMVLDHDNNNASSEFRIKRNDDGAAAVNTLFIVPEDDAPYVYPYGTSTGETGGIKFRELAASGGNFVRVKAPDAIGSNFALTLPNTDGSNTELMQTDGNGNLSWVDPTSFADDDWTGAGTGIMHPTTLTDDVSVGTTGAFGSFTVERAYTATDNSIYSRMTGSAAGDYVGLFSIILNTNSTNKYGLQNLITGTTGTELFGVYNDIRDTGAGDQYGVSSEFTGASSGDRYAIDNYFTAGTGFQFGVRNRFPNGSTFSNTIYGVSTSIESAGNGARFGEWIRTSGSGSGDRWGSYVSMLGSSNGEHKGAYYDIDATGTGDKYGVHVDIANGAGGTNHYGLFSSALKAGSTSWAGYFLGDVYIGTNTVNGYNFPATDGTATYLMQTDGSGQASWVDPATLAGDSDWTGAGTGTMYPGTLTDDVAIGTATSSGSLTVNRTYTASDVSIYSRMSGSSAIAYSGIINQLTGTNATQSIGLNVSLSGSSSIGAFGINNQNFDTGNSGQSGIVNSMGGSGSGAHTGTHNNFTAGSGTLSGTINSFPSAYLLAGTIYGSQTTIDAQGNGQRYGEFIRVAGIGTGLRYGSYIDMSGTSNAISKAAYYNITGSGTGDKYGLHVNLANTAGGTNHYGVYSSALKAGSSTWAGYFLGDVYIGTTVGNGYNLPGIDGTATYIMQTDGSGQASWVDPATLSSDDDWTRSGGDMYPTNIADDVGIGEATPAARLHVDGGTTPLRVDVSGTEVMRLNNRTLEFLNTVESVYVGEDAGISNSGLSDDNTAVGYQAMTANTSGDQNTAIGHSALSSQVNASNQNTAVGASAMLLNNGGDNNTAVGYNSLMSNVTGFLNTAVGAYSLENSPTAINATAVGAYSLRANNGANSPVAVGYQAMEDNTNGSFNTAVGSQALANNTNQANNTAIGYQAMMDQIAGANSNTAVGTSAMRDNLTGDNNVAMGINTMDQSNGGSNITAIGAEALSFLNTASDLTAVGYSAMNQNTSGTGNTAVGSEALRVNTTTSENTAIGYHVMEIQNVSGTGGNTAVGYDVLQTNTAGSNNVGIGARTLDASVTGSGIVAVGYNVLSNLSTVGELTAVGFEALRNNQTGIENTAVGYEALELNSSGSGNTAIGYRAMTTQNTNSEQNLAVGVRALTANTSGDENVALGYQALLLNTSAQYNTAVGHGALDATTTGGTNTALGHGAGSATTGTGNVYLGYQAGANHIGSDALFIDNSNTATPLIGGDFNLNEVSVTGEFHVSADAGFGTTTPTHKMEIVHNSSATDGHIRVSQSTANAGARIIFENEVETNNNWILFGRADDTPGNANVFNIYESSTGGNIIRAEGDGVNGLVGLASRNPTTNSLEISGQASKAVAGAWIANSDARLKKNIESMNSHEMLDKVLAMRGVTYEWDDDITGYVRPQGIQYGFVAQDLKKVWPTKVEEDADGYLQTAYGDYDAMFVEAIKAQQETIENQDQLITHQQDQIDQILTKLSQLEEALKIAKQ